MTAQEFWRRVECSIQYCRTSGNEGHDNSGVGFFISDIEQIIEEWNTEKHEFSL